ncbi:MULTISPECIES: NAD-dependent succinate-semialdehyde dehydrogenase [Methylobacteriaceae]|uniref:Succinate-semialdehyde dehydrogenase I, NADP-dependent, GabD-like n=1 Tax=Methylorubrum extorquens (strain DSM 6343 / CIP 106787 / DM4) TaxID=661410 RepID=C7CN19_METED|nr:MULTISPECIES: NAD-dependent succinate-semialdehyde dehydrogenase [Methylobacteriaceae]AYO84735.1 NAD-dependent succinate-semialdehyde dehydrogenase [Methylobacterium brachiatum]CAX17049.1 succinate-semialdehyde dehydrogenase I, NADP-dependent, GabD-like [Methylorubrum extorquens DM4]
MFDPTRALAFRREANLINGAWTSADGGGTLPVHDPASGREIGTVPLAGVAETRRAIEAADRTFPAWAARTAAERAALLLRLAEEIRRSADALAELLTFEQGKPLAEARGEIAIGAAYVQWFAEEARRIYGDVIPSPWPGRRLLVTREPVGVVGAITPWNFPFSMIARKLAAALAAGCTIVVKPSEFTPYSGLVWGILLERAGVPAGVANFVTGDAPAIGAELTTNPLVRKITFTGSTRVGKLLTEQAARSMKRVSMELGGNAPFLVFDDADLDAAVEGAVAAKYRNSGQTCVCTNRFYVQAGIYDPFAERLARRVEELRVGVGFEEGVQQGPLINAAALAKVEAHVADALAKGGRVLAGGGRHALGGTFYKPTVIAGGHAGMTVAREETFGPLSVLIPFAEEDEAVAAANDTEFGLAAYLYTRDLARTFRVSAALRYGMVGINDGIITTEVAPFGGVKESGLGREGSRYGLDEYVSMKYLSIGGLQ